MKREILAMIFIILIFIAIAFGSVFVLDKKNEVKPVKFEEGDDRKFNPEAEKEEITPVIVKYSETISENNEEIVITEEILYLAALAEAEAGNQDEMGKRLVIDTVLNRVESDNFPDGIIEVIDQENQYAVVENGSIEKVKIMESTIEIVLEEIERRTNTEVLYFRTDHFHRFGTDLFQHGDHYFSK